MAHLEDERLTREEHQETLHAGKVRVECPTCSDARYVSAPTGPYSILVRCGCGAEFKVMFCGAA